MDTKERVVSVLNAIEFTEDNRGSIISLVEAQFVTGNPERCGLTGAAQTPCDWNEKKTDSRSRVGRCLNPEPVDVGPGYTTTFTAGTGQELEVPVTSSGFKVV